MPPTVVEESTFGLGFVIVGVEIVPWRECVGNNALPGVAGTSVKSFVVRDSFLGLRFDNDVFLCIGGGMRLVSAWGLSTSSSAMVEFDNSFVSSGVPGESVMEMLECVEVSGVIGIVFTLMFVPDAECLSSGLASVADGISSNGA